MISDAAPQCRVRGGAIAQLGERLNGIQEVGGSTPPGSTTRPVDIASFWPLLLLMQPFGSPKHGEGPRTTVGDAGHHEAPDGISERQNVFSRRAGPSAQLP